MRWIKRLIIMNVVLGIVLALSLTTHCFGAQYDANTKTIKIDTSKQVTLIGLAEKAPVKIDGKLEKDKPQIVKADSGMLIRVRYMTDKPIMNTVTDDKGNVTETPSGDYYWAMVDGIGVELYDGKFVITYKSGTKEEITTKNYKFYQIKEKNNER